MTRDLSLEPLFPTSDIQGDILVGLLKKNEKLLFFAITDSDSFKSFLRTLEITSMQECLEQRAVIAQRKATGSPGLVSTPGLNLAFSGAGF